jgi:hypothetical protein
MRARYFAIYFSTLPPKVANNGGKEHARYLCAFYWKNGFVRERCYDPLVQHKADHERLLDEIRGIIDDVRGT